MSRFSASDTLEFEQIVTPKTDKLKQLEIQT
jgi:hypothetical protein